MDDITGKSISGRLGAMEEEPKWMMSLEEEPKWMMSREEEPKRMMSLEEEPKQMMSLEEEPKRMMSLEEPKRMMSLEEGLSRTLWEREIMWQTRDGVLGGGAPIRGETEV